MRLLSLSIRISESYAAGTRIKVYAPGATSVSDSNGDVFVNEGSGHWVAIGIAPFDAPNLVTATGAKTLSVKLEPYLGV